MRFIESHQRPSGATPHHSSSPDPSLAIAPAAATGKNSYTNNKTSGRLARSLSQVFSISNMPLAALTGSPRIEALFRCGRGCRKGKSFPTTTPRPTKSTHSLWMYICRDSWAFAEHYIYVHRNLHSETRQRMPAIRCPSPTTASPPPTTTYTFDQRREKERRRERVNGVFLSDIIYHYHVRFQNAFDLHGICYTQRWSKREQLTLWTHGWSPVYHFQDYRVTSSQYISLPLVD